MVWKTIKQKTSEALLSLAMVMLAIGCTQLDTKTEKPAPLSTTTSLNNFNNSSTPLSDITITAPITNPYTANSTSITISGTCTENATVYLSGGKHLNRFCLNQQFSFSVTPSSSGTIDFFIKQTSNTGRSSNSIKFTWIRDSSIPTTPVITSPTEPYHSNLTSITIEGTCTSGNIVTMSGAQSSSTSCSNDNKFSFDSTQSTDSAHLYSFVQKNANNTPSASVDFTWNRDTVAPLAPTIVQPTTNPYSSIETTVAISGGCENMATVKLSGAENSSVTCTDNSYSFTVSKSVDGTYIYSLDQTDLAGNTSVATSFTWNRDNTPPSQLTITNHTSPFISNTSTLLLIGTCENGSTVNIGGDVTTSTLCISDQFSVTIPKSTDGTYQFTLNQTDPAGTTSTSINFVWTRDTTAPIAIVITNPATSPFTSSDGSLSVSGTCETDAVVNLAGDSTDTKTCVGETFSFSINKSTDGTYNFSFNQSDAALNTSSPTTLTWIKTSASPPTPVIISPTPNPYHSSESNLTITGSCIDGNTVEMSGDDSGTQTCMSGGFSFTVSKSNDATYSFNFRQTNSTNDSSGAATFTWIRDTTAPSAPTITIPSTSPYHTNSDSIVISGSCEAGSAVNLSGDVDLDSTTCSNANSYSFTINKITDGSYQFIIDQKDLSGNTSPNTSKIWIRDTVAPIAVTITNPANNSYLSSDSTLMVSGTCEALSGNISLSGDATGTTPCNSFGNFTFSINKNVDGTYNFSFIQTDLAGNHSNATMLTWTRSTTMPITPVITSPNPNPLVSNSSQITITASCDTTQSPLPSLVALDGDISASEVVTPSGALTQDCSSSPVSFVIQKNTDSTFHFSINQTNQNNSLSSADAMITWTRDTVAPAAPTITSPSASPFTAPGNLIIEGGCEANSTVTLSGDDAATTTCSTGNTYSFTVAKSDDGSYSFGITQTDAASNTSPSISLTWNRLSGSIAAPLITSPSLSTTTNNASTLIITGTCNNGYTVTLTGDAASTTTCSNDAFQFTINKSIDATYNFNVKQSIYGNDSPDSTRTWVRDTLAPTTTITSTPLTTNYFLTATFEFSSNEAGSSFLCKLDTDSTFSSCTSAKTFSVVTNGSRTFTVKATDPAGNVGAEKTHIWTQNGYKTIALYHFNNGTLSADSGPYGNTLSLLTNTPSVDSACVLPAASPTCAKFSSSRSFQATSNTSLNLGKDQMTIEGRIKLTSLLTNVGDYFTLLSKSGASGSYGWELRLKKVSAPSAGTVLEFVASLNGTDINTVTSSVMTLNTTAFYYFASTWNSGTVKLYFGSSPIEVGSGNIGTAGSATIATSTANLKIGANQTSGSSPSYRLMASLDEVRISQTVRTITTNTTEFNSD